MCICKRRLYKVRSTKLRRNYIFFLRPQLKTNLCFFIKKKVKGKTVAYHIKLSFINVFNKSERHLEFSMNDVIRGKILHVAKMATKDETSVYVDFAVCSYKKECFFFISRGIFSLYNVFIGMLSYL